MKKVEAGNSWKTNEERGESKGGRVMKEHREKEKEESDYKNETKFKEMRRIRLRKVISGSKTEWLTCKDLNLRDATKKTCQERWMIGMIDKRERNRERERERESQETPGYQSDLIMIIYIYIYIYIYIIRRQNGEKEEKNKCDRSNKQTILS